MWRLRGPRFPTGPQVRPWHRRRDATGCGVRGGDAGDELAPSAQTFCTRAIAIDALACDRDAAVKAAPGTVSRRAPLTIRDAVCRGAGPQLRTTSSARRGLSATPSCRPAEVTGQWSALWACPTGYARREALRLGWRVRFDSV